ncbi:unnamed protein product [Schistosoma mattheei]|uniref:Uncharacterized protein n=1 Tax=Schistosoma mattheei TaxID=31246 RepID=A0A183PNY8_9TREM|nr:unnamed protein product [Schistosoma mattheei]
MGKKSAKDKSPKVGDLHIISDPKDYVVTGILENDFPGLCRQIGVTHCPIVSTKHSQAIITQTVSSLPSSKRSKEDKKSPQSQHSSVTKYSDVKFLRKTQSLSKYKLVKIRDTLPRKSVFICHVYK